MPSSVVVVQRCLDFVLIEFRDREVFAVDDEVPPALPSFGDANVHSLCLAIRIGSRLVALNPVLFIRKTTVGEIFATLLKFAPRYFPFIEWSHYPFSLLASSWLCQSTLWLTVGSPSACSELSRVSSSEPATIACGNGRFAVRLRAWCGVRIAVSISAATDSLLRACVSFLRALWSCHGGNSSLKGTLYEASIADASSAPAPAPRSA